MKQATLDAIFTKDYLDTLMPEETSDQFFKALYRDSSDGAYDIRLKFISANDKRIVLAFSLIQWPGKCLVSNLT